MNSLIDSPPYRPPALSTPGTRVLQRGACRPARPWRKVAAAAVAVSTTCILAAVAGGQTWVAPGSGVWSDAVNWQGGVPASSPSTQLTFRGRTLLNSPAVALNDLANPFEFQSMTLDARYGFAPFNAPFSSLTLGGHAVQTASTGSRITHVAGGAVTIDSPIAVVGGLTLDGIGHGHLRLSSLSGGGTVVVDRPGDGHVVVDQATLSGEVHLRRGHLSINSSAALGSATLRVQGGTLRANSFLSPDGLTLPNPIIAESDVVFTGNNSLVFSGPMSGPGAFIHRPNASITARFQVAQSYTGPTVIDLPTAGTFAGTLRLEGDGTALGSPSFSVARFGSLVLDHRSVRLPARIAENALVTLESRAQFNLQAHPTLHTQQRIGRLVASGSPFVGINTEQATATAASGTLLIDQFEPTAGSMTLIRGIALGSAAPGTAGVDNVLLGNVVPSDLVGGGGPAGSTTVSILRHVVGHDRGLGTTWFGGGNSLATYDSVRGVRPLDLATEYVTAVPTGLATQHNVRLTTLQAGVDTDTTVNALVLDRVNSADYGRIEGAGTLRVTSGVVVAAGVGGNASPTSTLRNRIDVDTLDFGTEMARIYAPERLTISSRIVGTGGLSKTGGFELFLANPANSYTGPVYVGGGTLRVAAPEALGGTGPITLDGGTLQIDNSSTLNRPIVAGRGVGMINLPASVEVVLADGSLSGDDFEKTGAGSLRIPADVPVTLSRRLSVLGGSLILEAAPAHAALTIMIRAGGTLVSDGQPITLPQTLLLDAGAASRTIETRSPLRLTGRLRDAGSIGNALPLVKTGSSVLELDLAADFDGPLLIQEGTVRVDGLLRQVNTASPGVAVFGGARLAGNGTLERNIQLSDNAIVAPGAPLTVLGDITTLGNLRLEWSPNSRLNVDGDFGLPPGDLRLALDNLGGLPFAGPYVLVDALSLSGSLGNVDFDFTRAPEWASLPLQVLVTPTQLILVPEPGPVAGMLVAALAFGRRRRPAA